MFSCEYCEIFKNSIFIEHFRWLLLDLFLASGSSRLEMFCKKGVLTNSAKFTAKHKKEKKETLAHWFSSKFCHIYKNSFSYRLSSVAASVHVIPHSLPISHIFSRFLTVYLPFHFPVKNIKWTLKTYIHLMYPLLQILLLLVTFYKRIPAGRILLKKFIFKCEGSSYLDFIPLKIKLQKILDSYIRKSINSMIIASSKSTLLTYMLT